MTPVVVTRDATAGNTLAVGAELAYDSSSLVVEGLGSAYGVYYNVTDHLGSYRERIHPGAATASLATHRPTSQWAHGHDPAVGQAPILALDVVRDQADGIYFRGRLLEAPTTRLIAEGLKAGEITGASIRMGVLADEWSKDKRTREIRAIRLYEVGLVAMPANPAAKVKVSGRTATATPAMSARARRYAMLYTAGVATWSEIPADVRVELAAGASPRIAAAALAAGRTRR